MGTGITLSNIVSVVKDYLVSNDERTLFDWIVFTQRGFGLGLPFRHSIAQVRAATNVARHTQDKCFAHFVALGFLQQAKENYGGKEYRSFFIDFKVLSKPEVLGEIIRPTTDTHREMLVMFTEWAKEQAKSEKPLSKKQLKEEKAKLEAVDSLMPQLNRTYAERVQMFNEGKLTEEKPERAKNSAALVCNLQSKKALSKLLQVYDEASIDGSFLAYTDDLLKGQVCTKKILPYFLTYENGSFVVADRYLEKYTLEYGRKNI